MGVPLHQRSLRAGIASHRPRSERTAWFTWPILLGLAAAPLVLAFKVEGDAFPAVLGYTNCVIGAAALIFFARKGRIEAAIPLLFLPLLLVAWPLASLYFAVFYPDMSYGLMDRPVRMLFGNERVQGAVLLFLSGYVPVVVLPLWLLSKNQIGTCRNPGRLADVVAIMAALILAINSLSKVVALPGPMIYVIDGLLIYSQGMLFVPGALIGRLSRAVKICLALFLPGMVFFYTLGNARAMAVLPCIMFLIGVLFFSHIKARTKLVILGGIVFLLPMYLVVGNATRELTGSIGFRDLGKRWEALQRWEEVAERTPAAAAALGRFFFTGGHSIITRTPEERPFLDFEWAGYIKEAFASLLPGRLYYEPVYRGNWILSRYGFMITEQTSVEVSMLGNLWLLGGYQGVFLGGVAAGFLHGFLMGIFRIAGGRNGFLGLLFLGVVGSRLLGAAGQDIISQWRAIVWHLIFAVVFWLVAATLAGHWWSRSPEESVAG